MVSAARRHARVSLPKCVMHADDSACAGVPLPRACSRSLLLLRLALVCSQHLSHSASPFRVKNLSPIQSKYRDVEGNDIPIYR